MGGEAARRNHQCVDCRAWSPDIDENVTLVSGMGWRLHRRLNDAGEMVFEWRCPPCWARFKQRKAGTPIDGVPAARSSVRENPSGWASREADLPPSSRTDPRRR